MFALILQVGTCRALHSKCHPRHFFTLVATFAKCSTYYSVARNIFKNRLRLLNQFPSPLLCKQAFNEWQRIFFIVLRGHRARSLCSRAHLVATFAKCSPYFSSLERFVVPSNICLPAAFPRSYVRKMQPILQLARTFLKNRLRLLNQSFTHHLHMQASDVAVNN